MAKLFHPNKYHPDEPPTPQDKYIWTFVICVLELGYLLYRIF
jgi:hypothetical protein